MLRKNADAITDLKNRREQERKENKDFWQMQLESTKQIRQQAKDAEEVFKRQEVV